ncbi:hypothetical protein D6853_00955 [Butyrivibrio sp. X503]|uniref:hypothetical protein n=1 Tax=Butyrivibrio sp. X503 TaxID=2364878 RepID=UPI000EA84735|nr:hypothetical protein [Butyrivibrio sp. X503]RKM58137.1 hypothetical protein D6853_00955 [Butyrivibrio sp. X503]
MSELSKRTAKYYFVQGIKLFLVMLLGIVIFGAVWTNIYLGEVDITDKVLYRILSFGGVFMIMMNMMYSMYSPGWYDNMVLSMGARRKDIFFGDFIKQITFIICNMLLYSTMALAVHKSEHIKRILICGVFALLMGAVGIIVGHIIKKYGRTTFIVISVVCSATFGLIMCEVANGIHLFGLGENKENVISIAAVLLFVFMEYVIYRLNRKVMVV